MDRLIRDAVLDVILEDADRANAKDGQPASAHEALGVLVEEVDELRNAIHKNRAASVEEEAIQVASVAYRVRILRDLADAMAYAHQHGVVHRDIMPENVMLSGRHALVTDFGVAKAVNEATGRQTLTTAGVALGTPTYMAPEQAAADPHADHRVDLYALGVTAYELLAGQPPFVGATPQAVLAAHVTEAPVHVTQRRATIPPALAQLIMRCLEKKPEARFQSAQDLAFALRSLASGPTPAGGRFRLPTRQAKAAVALLLRAGRRLDPVGGGLGMPVPSARR